MLLAFYSLPKKFISILPCLNLLLISVSSLPCFSAAFLCSADLSSCPQPLLLWGLYSMFRQSFRAEPVY